MTKDALEAIQRRAEKVTPGKWRVTLDDAYDRTYVLGAFRNGITVIADIKGDDNAEFIAHAQEDVAKLLDHVSNLRSKLALYEAYAQEYDYYAILNEMEEADANGFGY